MDIMLLMAVMENNYIIMIYLLMIFYLEWEF
jgi:hypothetical protein